MCAVYTDMYTHVHVIDCQQRMMMEGYVSVTAHHHHESHLHVSGKALHRQQTETVVRQRGGSIRILHVFTNDAAAAVIDKDSLLR